MAKRMASFEFDRYLVGKSKLELSSLGMVDEDISSLCEFLKQHPHIIHVDLHDNRLTPQGARLLAEVASIETLDISSNQLGANGAKEIARMRKLKSLDISDNEIGHEGLLAIAKLPNLSKLNIVATQTKVSKIKLSPPVSLFMKLSHFAKPNCA